MEDLSNRWINYDRLQRVLSVSTGAIVSIDRRDLQYRPARLSVSTGAIVSIEQARLSVSMGATVRVKITSLTSLKPPFNLHDTSTTTTPLPNAPSSGQGEPGAEGLIRLWWGSLPGILWFCFNDSQSIHRPKRDSKKTKPRRMPLSPTCSTRPAPRGMESIIPWRIPSAN